MTAESHGFWISKCCGAVCHRDDRECWNCGQRRNHAHTAHTFKTECRQCGTEFVGLTDGREEIALCPFYFEHNPPNVYYPPNFMPAYLWELNGYRYDAATKKMEKTEDLTQ